MPITYEHHAGCAVSEKLSEVCSCGAFRRLLGAVPIFIDGLRGAADEDEATGNHLQAAYLRDAADLLVIVLENTPDDDS